MKIKVDIKNNIDLVVKNIKYVIYNIINCHYAYFLWLFPIKKNKIVVTSYYGKSYGGNGKYITQELLNREGNYDIVWLLRNPKSYKDNIPKGIRVINYKSFKAIYEIATAKIWIDNSRKTRYAPKRRSQFYIQTWHSCLRLKKIEKDAEDTLSELYVRSAKKDSKNIDVLIAGCEFSKNTFKNSFWYDGKIETIGSPRCDLFFNNNNKIIQQIYNKYNINEEYNIVMYAPTFRNDKNMEIKISSKNLLGVLEEKFKGKWVMFYRMHPNIMINHNIINDKRVIDVTRYDDMQELIHASEILITDYSSSMFDAMIAKKKCFLFCYDYERYINKERGLYFDIKSLPFPFAVEEEELYNNIIKYNDNEYHDNINKMNKKVGMYPNYNSSERVVKIINNIIKQ